MPRSLPPGRALPAALAVAALAALAAALADARRLTAVLAAVVAILALLLLLLLLWNRPPGPVSAARPAGAPDRRSRQRREADAVELTRRQVAAQLRDRVLEDLAGVGYALSHPYTDNARLAAVVQETIRTLRQVLLDVQPPALTGDTLGPAIDDLTAGLRMAGVTCVIRVPADLPLTPAAAGLLHRIVREALRERSESLGAAREALRAVEGAAGARRVEVTVTPATGTVTMTVDGAWTDPAADALRLLCEEMSDAGGTLTTAPDGTRLTATLPAT